MPPSPSEPRPGSGGSVVLIRDPRYRAGGFETWVETLAAGLRQRGILVHLLVPTPGGAETDAIQAENGRWTIPAVEGAESQAAEVLRALELLAAQGHAGIFFNLGYRYISLAGLHLGGSPWIPVPVAHGRHPADLDWILCGPPRRIVSPSSDYAATLRKELARRIGRLRALGRVWAIPHGVPLPPADRVCEKWRHPHHRADIAVVSRLDESAKRPWDYLRIAERLAAAAAPFRMRILGDGPCEAAMRTWILERQLQDRVHMEGAVSRAAVSECLADSQILISTSESEAFGLSVAEALAHTCAVISADIPGTVREMLMDGRGIRVPAGDIAAFADAVIRLAADWPAASRMGFQGRQYVARHYSTEQMVAGYCALLRRLHRHFRPAPDWRAPPVRYLSPGDALAARSAGPRKLLRFFRDIGCRKGGTTPISRDHPA